MKKTGDAGVERGGVGVKTVKDTINLTDSDSDNDNDNEWVN